MAFAIPVLRVQLRFVNCINKRKKKQSFQQRSSTAPLRTLSVVFPRLTLIPVSHRVTPAPHRTPAVDAVVANTNGQAALLNQAHELKLTNRPDRQPNLTVQIDDPNWRASH